MPMELVDTDRAKAATAEELTSQLDADREKGLSPEEAQQRLATYGPNEIPEKHQSMLVKFLKTFWGPIPVMIEAAAVLSAIDSAWNDFVVICFLLLMNGTIDFVQSRKADNAIAMLKQSLASKTNVLRSGSWISVEARDLVPGDIVRVRLGEVFPADVKMVGGDYLLADEAALTGESLPVEKHVGDIAYSGSVAKQGAMDGLVYGTGLNTFFGRTAKLVAGAQTKSHFQAAVVKIGQYLIALNFALIAVVILDALFRGPHGIGSHIDWWNELTFCLVLTVAAIPAALPAVMSVTMAVGALVLSKKKAIVSKLMAIEEMAGIDILCSDKTGTITKNQLSVTGYRPVADFTDADIQLYAALASEADNVKDPIDSAVMGKLRENAELVSRMDQYKQTEFKPFDPVSKYSEAQIRTPDGECRVSKGAPQAILGLAFNKDAIADKVNGIVDAAGERGYRTLGIGKTNAEGKWEYVGLLEFMDPPRDDSAETIRNAQALGVTVKMITGDHGAIAKETCRQVGIGDNVLEAGKLTGLPDRQATKLVESADGFSEVFPEHKYEIVELLQKNGHIVGMTGDGVNDAPALKKADCGTAVDGATDAAKAAADLVLTEPGLSVVVSAIEEARRIFQRLQSYAIYRIGETIDVLFFTVVAILVWGKFPVNPIMIILLALFNDFPIMTIATDHVKYSSRPENWNMRRVIGIASVVGFLDVVFTLGLFAFCYNFLLNDAIAPQSIHAATDKLVNNYQYAAQWLRDMFPSITFAQLQTVAFLQLLMSGNLTIFICRTVGPFWKIAPGKGLFWSSLISKVIITLAIWNWAGLPIGGCWGIIPPLPWQYIALVWGYAFIERMIISDQVKVLAYRLFDYAGIRFRRLGRVHR